jgi:hypothetical protein
VPFIQNLRRRKRLVGATGSGLALSTNGGKTMNAELLTKLTALSEKELAYLNGVVDGLNAAATNALEATKRC